MNILHTSDWHLGQLFYGKSREQEQAAFLNWLVAQVHQQAIDAIVVAGDLFDTGTPPSYARTLYNRFIVRLHQECPGCQLILLAGNHDSVAVLNESKSLLAALNTRVIAGVDITGIDRTEIDRTGADDGQSPSELLIELKNADGQPAAVLCALPFLRPADLMRSRAGLSSEQKKQQLQQQIADYYQSLYQQAKQHYPDLPVIMTGHLTTVGASTSESVKEIYIGTLDAFPASAFPPADYIALGHIHRPQKVAKSDHIRYCGSPVALSFDELGREKQVLIARFSADGLQQVDSLPVPVFQPMVRLNGDLDRIAAQLDQLQPRLSELQDGDSLWAEINVETDDYLADLQPRIEALVADRPIEILRIRRENRQRRTLADYQPSAQLDELSTEEVFLKRLSQEASLEPERQAALLDCFRQIQQEAEQ